MEAMDAEEIEIPTTMTFEAPNLDIPDPPPDLPYEDYADYQKRELLKANGFGLGRDDLLTVLQTKTGVLQAAAAHTAGAQGERSLIPILKDLLGSQDDTVKMEAAYALVRLGVPAAKATLVECLGLALDAHLSPAEAAGYLARLGDPQGYPTVSRALASDLSAIRMLACKQLSLFVPFHGAPDGQGHPIDAFDLFDRALRDPDSSVQWQALVQLRQLRAPQARPALEAYVARATDPHLREVARQALPPERHA